MRTFDNQYILKWISEIAPKLAPKMSFDDWMGSFSERYPQSLLSQMREVWNKFTQEVS